MNFTFHLNLAHILFVIGTAVLSWLGKKLLDAIWTRAGEIVEHIRRLIAVLESLEDFEIKTDATYKVVTALHPNAMSRAMADVMKKKNKKTAAASAGNGDA